MAAPIALREDFDALALWGLAKKTRDANQSRRLLALAEIYDGGSRGQAARIGGIGVGVKLKTWDFQILTRQRRLSEPADVAETIYSDTMAVIVACCQRKAGVAPDRIAS